MALLLAANVQLSPFRVPVKGNALGTLVELIQATEIIVLDITSAVNVKQAEGNLVLGIGFQEEVLEDAPVREGNFTLVLGIGNAEENGVLLPIDFVL